MDELLDVLKTMNITLPDEKMNADELLWWIIGYRACIDQVEFIAKMLKEQEQAGSLDILMGEIYEKAGTPENE